MISEDNVAVVLLCAEDGEPRLIELVDAMHGAGMPVEVVPGIDREVGLLSQAVDRTPEPALFVLCRTPELDRGEVRRLAGMFSARRAQRHDLHALAIDGRPPAQLLAEVRQAMRMVRGRRPTPNPDSARFMRDVVGPMAMRAPGAVMAETSAAATTRAAIVSVPEPTVDAEALARELAAGLREAEALLDRVRQRSAYRRPPAAALPPTGAATAASPGHVPDEEIDASTEPLEVTLERDATDGVPLPIRDDSNSLGDGLGQASGPQPASASVSSTSGAGAPTGTPAAASRARPPTVPPPAPPRSLSPRVPEPFEDGWEPLPPDAAVAPDASGGPTTVRLPDGSATGPMLPELSTASAAATRVRTRWWLAASGAGLVALVGIAVSQFGSFDSEAAQRRATTSDASTPASTRDTVPTAREPGPTAGASAPAVAESPRPTGEAPPAEPDGPAAPDEPDEPEIIVADEPGVPARNPLSAIPPPPESDLDDPMPDEGSGPGGRLADEEAHRRLSSAADAGHVALVGELFVDSAGSSMRSWDDAMLACRRKRVDGVGRWRLPNKTQVLALKQAGKLDDGAYWTRVPEGEDEAYAYDVESGGLNVWLKIETTARALCVNDR